MNNPTPEDSWDDADDDWMVGIEEKGPSPGTNEKVTPALTMVETAFLASTTALIWLISVYIPTGPLMRIFLSLPVVLACMRWGKRAGWMTAVVAGLLLSVLMGPPRSIQFFMPYGILGVVLGSCWKAQRSWYVSMGWGILISALGLFFQIGLLSLLLSTNVWIYLNQQATGILEWILVQFDRLVLFLFNINLLVIPNVIAIQIFAVGMIFLNSLLYILLVHLIASLLFERLNYPIPEPPEWLADLLED